MKRSIRWIASCEQLIKFLNVFEGECLLSDPWKWGLLVKDCETGQGWRVRKACCGSRASFSHLGLSNEPAIYRIGFVFGSFSGGGGRTSELLDWLSKAT
jgi:hypothetical protein